MACGFIYTHFLHEWAVKALVIPSACTAEFKHWRLFDNTISTKILTDFKNATLTSLYIFQNTVVCKIALLRRCQPKLSSSTNALVLIVQLNWTTLFAPYEFIHLSMS